MKNYTKSLLLSLLALLTMSTPLSAQNIGDGDSLKISLLTCGPGDDVYELYGHTALRVHDLRSGDDLVFNYGIFDFDTPNFAWRFMLGQTDYKLGVLPFDRFAYSYARHGRYVDEQELNLNAREKSRLWEALQENWSDKYWTYRYNFLYDNCTTRAVAQVESCVEGKIVWPTSQDGKRSFRMMLHEFTSKASPWNCFGQDLLLGQEVDRPIYVEQQMFSPIYAEHFFDAASIKSSDGTMRLLVSKKQRVVDMAEKTYETFPVSPLMASFLLLAVVLLFSIWEYRRKHLFFVIDYLLMLVQGVAGCVIGLLFFFSEHPAVDTNWLILLLNPLPLVFLPFKIWRDYRRKRDYYYPLMAVALMIFVGVSLFGKQNFPTPFMVLALILLMRIMVSMVVYPYMRMYHKRRRHSRHRNY